MKAFNSSSISESSGRLAASQSHGAKDGSAFLMEAEQVNRSLRRRGSVNKSVNNCPKAQGTRARRHGVSSAVRSGMALLIRQLPNGARPRGPACFNSKLSHLIDQRRTRQSEPIGRSLVSSDQPVGFLQSIQDMFPIGIGKRA